jgi:autotransporter-associated beta strand protein
MKILHQVRAFLTRALLPAVAVAVGLGVGQSAQAQTNIFKQNNTTDLSTTPSWTTVDGGSTQPGAVNASDIGIIDANFTSASTLTYGSNLTLGGLTITSPSNAVIINPTALTIFNLGNNTFTNGGGINMSAATKSLTLGANVSLNLSAVNTQEWNIDSQGLTVNGPLSMINGANLSLIGSGPTTLGGVISGGGSLYFNSTSTTTLSGVNTFTGGIFLNSGTLVVTNNGTAAGSSLGGPSNVLTIAGGSIDTGASAVSFNGATSTDNTILLRGSFTFVGTNNLNLGGGLTFLDEPNTTITTTASTLTFNGSIVDGGALNYSNANSITKAGAGGTLALNATNTFSGNFNMQAGTLTLNSNTALQNATLNYTGGTIGYGANTNITVAGLAGSTNLALPSANLTIATGPFTNATYSAVLSGGGAVIISGNGTETFSGANSYTGGTNLTGGTLVLNNLGTGATSALGSGALNITGGTLDAGSAMNVGTAIATNNTLTFGGSFTFAGSNNLNLGTGAVTLVGSPTITVANDTLTVGGKISGSSGLTLAGNGTLALTNTTSNYSGATTINGGILQVASLANGGTNSSIGASTAAGTNLFINGGTLQVISTAPISSNHLIELGTSATIDSSSSGAANTLSFSNSSTVVYNGTGLNPVLTFTGTQANTTTPNSFNITLANDSGATTGTSVVKNGIGEWALNATNTYTGGTTINQGTLMILNSAALGTGTLAIGNNSATAALDNGNASVTTLSSTLAQNWNGNWTFVGTHALDMNTGAVTLDSNTTLTVTANTLTIGGNIGDGSQGYSLTKAGAGTLVLNGNDTFSGNLNLNTGTLTLGNNTAAQNATLFVNGTSSPTLTFGTTAPILGGLAGNLNLTGPTSSLTINTSNIKPANNGAADQTAYTFANLTYSGNFASNAMSFSMNGNGTENLSGNNAYTGGTTLNGGVLGINNGGNATTSSIGTGNLTFNGGNIDNSSGSTQTLATNNNITINSGFTFEGTNSLNLGTGNITLNTTIPSTSNQITVAGHTLTLGGNISGTGEALVLLGSSASSFGGGTLVLTGNSTYSGGTTVDAGWLDINNGGNTTTSAIGTGQLVLNGGNIDTSGNQTFSLTTPITQIWEANFTFGGSGNLNFGASNVTISNTPIISITGNMLTDSGIIQGTGFTLNGQGTLALTNGSNNYTGVTTLNGGTLSITKLNLGGAGNLSGIGNSTNAAANLIFNGGTLQSISSTAGTQTTDRLFTLGINGGTLDMSGATANVTTWSNTSSLVFSGTNINTTLTLTGNSGSTTASTNIFDPVISNNGTGKTSVVKNGTGEWELNATNTYTGGTTINQGTLALNTAGALGGAGGSITIGNNTNTAALDNSSGATLTLSQALTQNWNGNWTFVGTKSLDMNTGAISLNGPVSLTLSGLAANTLTVGGTISDSGAGYMLTKSGTGTLSLGSSSTAQDFVLNTSGGTVTFSATTASVGGLAGGGAITGPSTTFTLNTLSFANATNENYTGVLTGGAMALVVNGTGIQELSGANSYTGGTTVNGGTLEVNNASALGTGGLTMNGGNLDSGSAVTIANNLTISKNFTFVGTSSLTDSGNVSLGVTGANTINVTANTLTLGGHLGGSLTNGTTTNGLTKTGAGTLVLTGFSNYTGATTVNGGTLNLNFTANNTANIVNSSSALVLGGGQISITGLAGAANTNTQVFASTTINAGNSSIVGTMTTGNATGFKVGLGSVSRSVGGTVDVTYPAHGFINATVTTLNNVVTNGGIAYMTFNGTNFANATSGSTSNISAATSTSTAAGSFAATVNNLMTANTTTISATHQALNTLLFTGGASTLDLNSLTLTMNAGGIMQSSTISAGDTISNGTLTGPNTANSELVFITNNAAQTLTVSAVIADASAGNTTVVTKSGNGTLNLTGTNTYKGNTYLNSGTINFGSAAALGATGNFVINGGSFDNTNATVSELSSAIKQTWNNNFTFVGSHALDMNTGAVTLGNNVTLTTTASTLTESGAIGGGFSLTKAGSGGTLVLNATNTFTGGVNLNAGTLILNNTAALGTGIFSIGTIGGAAPTFDYTNGTAANANNNQQNWNSSFTFTGTDALNMGTGNVALNANSTVTVSGNVLTIGGNIGGNLSNGDSQFGITKAGASGTLILSGNNNYNGGTTLSAGTLVLSGNNAGTGATTLNGGTLFINQGNSGSATSSALGTGALVIGSTVTIDNNSTADQTIGTNNTINVNSSFTYAGATHSLTFSGGNVVLSGSPTITVSGNTLAFDGTVSGASGLTKLGAGTLLLGGNNTYAGATNVFGGTLELAANLALGVNQQGTTVAGGATLQLDSGYVTGNTGTGISSSTGSLLTLGNATSTGTLLNGAGNANWLGNITLGNSTTINSGTSASGVLTLGNSTAASLVTTYGNITNITLGSNALTFTGGAGTKTLIESNITGNGGSVTVNTAGTVEFFTPTNSYSGFTYIQNGTLIVVSQSNGTNITVGEGNLAIASSNITIGDGVGSANTAILQMGTGAFTDNRLLNDQATVTINSDGEFNTLGQTQLIGNLTMTGGYITTNGTGGNVGLLSTNGNATITIQSSTLASTIDGNFSAGGSAGTTMTDINIVRNGSRTSDFTINANLTGGSILLNGNGTANGILTLTNNLNSFTGSMEVSAGTLVITASNALGVNPNGAAGQGTQVDSGAQLQIGNTTSGGTIAVGNELLTLNGSGPGGAGALQVVNATASWSGNVNSASNATVNTTSGTTLTLSGNVYSTTGGTLTFNGAGNTTISGTLAGSLGLNANMNSGSTLLVTNTTADTSYTGATTVNNGTLELKGNTTAIGTALINTGNTLTINTGGTLLTDTNGTVASNVSMVLNGGTWATNALGSTTGATAQSKFTDTINTLTLTATSNISLGSGNNTLNIANSNGVNWTPGQILYINNWTGNGATSITSDYVDGLNGGGGQDQIIFGSDTTGLDGSAYTGQLGEIIFVNPQDTALGWTGTSGNFHAVIESNGEVVPFLVATPEPGTVAAGAALGALALLRELRRRRKAQVS